VNLVEPHIASLFGFPLPPRLALLLTVALIVFLFRRDIRENPNVTSALWLPLLWLVITCSRPVSAWLNIFGLPVAGAASLEDGSPLDACFYFTLIAGGIYVLNQRQVNLGEIFRNNGWLVVFLLYFFIAITWSDIPLVALKRWVKTAGLPIMALIVFTEPDLEEALARLMKRCAYVIIPVSILFIKYYPELGRTYDQWTGQSLQAGVAMGKNGLGFNCLMFGFFFFWHLLQTWKADRSKARRNELLLIGVFLIMISWLLRQAHSATSVMCLLVGISVMVLLGRRWVNKRFIVMYILLAIVVLVLAELTFGISAYVAELLQRDATLTNRTLIWADLLKMKTNPIFGVGFESFWSAERVEQLPEGFASHINEAHNGYLETYLTLGLVGLFILVGLLIAAFRKIRQGILSNFQFGRFRLGFFIVVVMYNWTEVSFRGVHPLWLIFYIIAMEYPRSPFFSVEPAFGATTPDEEIELVYSPNELGMLSGPGYLRSEISARLDHT